MPESIVPEQKSASVPEEGDKVLEMKQTESGKFELDEEAIQKEIEKKLLKLPEDLRLFFQNKEMRRAIIGDKDLIVYPEEKIIQLWEETKQKAEAQGLTIAEAIKRYIKNVKKTEEKRIIDTRV